MASLTKHSKTGVWKITCKFDGRRRNLHLGKWPKSTAQTWLAHVKELERSMLQGVAPSPATSTWVASLSPELHKKLVGRRRPDGAFTVGLVAPREAEQTSAPATLKAFLDDYVQKRFDVKKSTSTVFKHSRRNLIAFFGPDKELASITQGDADNFRRWLNSPRKMADRASAKAPWPADAAMGGNSSVLRTVCN